MALTRAFVKDILADYENRDELTEQIIAAHVDSVSGLKEEAEQVKAEAEETRSIRDRVEKMREEIEAIQPSGRDWEREYKALSAELAAIKAEDRRDNRLFENAEAFCHLLVSHGMAYHMAKAISMGGFDIIRGIELQNGKVRNYDAISAAIRSEYRDLLC